MRLVVATFVMLLGGAMLLPAATALPAFAQVAPSASASVAPSASVEPSASPVPTAPPSDPCMMVDPDLPECHDAEVFLNIVPGEPVREWAFAVTGGVPFEDVAVIDPSLGVYLLTLTMPGESAILEMTTTLPAGAQLIRGSCFDASDEVPFDVLVPPRRLVLEVVRGTLYECSYRSDFEGAPAPTAPPTDSVPAGQRGSSSGGWPLVFALMATIMAASLLIAARARPRDRTRP